MSILLTTEEIAYIHSEEFKHPKSRPEKRRVARLRQKWIKRAMKDLIFKTELVNVLGEKK